MYHEVDNFPITELSTMFSSFHIISDCADTGDSFHTCKKKSLLTENFTISAIIKIFKIIILFLVFMWSKCHTNPCE